MTLVTDLNNDMQSVFLNTDEFAESVVYTPKGGTATTIPAIVKRNPADSTGYDQARVLHKTAHITIHNDATNGVTEINTKGDKVQFAYLSGEDAVWWDVIRIIESSTSHWKLEVTR